MLNIKHETYKNSELISRDKIHFLNDTNKSNAKNSKTEFKNEIMLVAYANLLLCLFVNDSKLRAIRATKVKILRLIRYTLQFPKQLFPSFFVKFNFEATFPIA